MTPNVYCMYNWWGSRMCTCGDLDQDTHLYLLRGNYKIVCLNWTFAWSIEQNINGMRLLGEYFKGPCFHSHGHFKATWNESAQNIFWARLNRLRNGLGRFHSSMYKWDLASSWNWECGTTEQTADHVISSCLIHHVPRGTRGLQVLDDAKSMLA